MTIVGLCLIRKSVNAVPTRLSDITRAIQTAFIIVQLIISIADDLSSRRLSLKKFPDTINGRHLRKPD